MTKKRISLFHEGNAELSALLGGKGANLAEMTNIGLPVPPGFTITTEVCTEYYSGEKCLPTGLADEITTAIADVEKKIGKKLGDRANPLLVSVRSGAKFSMPGMMDTILNLGLNDETIRGLINSTNDERFAYDAYRRFIMMFSNVVMGIPKEEYEQIFKALKKRLDVKFGVVKPKLRNEPIAFPVLITYCFVQDINGAGVNLKHISIEKLKKLLTLS